MIRSTSTILPSRRWLMHRLAVLFAACTFAAAVPPGAAAATAEENAAGVHDRLPWHEEGVWLHGDLHIHHLLMDSSVGTGLASAASEAKLDFIAMTDHAQDFYAESKKRWLTHLRGLYPGLIILAGIEWNLPGGDHASLVVEESPREWELLRTFSERFDRRINAALIAERPERDDATWGDLARAEEGLRWLEDERQRLGVKSVVYLNHLSRHDYLSTSDVARLRGAGLAGVEASPGHQKRRRKDSQAIDRYEPFVAVIGGGYDEILARGGFLGISSGSDFHVAEKLSGHLPGKFSRSLVYAPSRTSAGIIEGLAAGCTATVLDNLVTSIETRTSFKGLKDFALIGETLKAPVGAEIAYRILARVPRKTARGRTNRLDRVEIISDCLGSPRQIKFYDDVGRGKVDLTYTLPPEATEAPRKCYLRVRGRRFVGGAGNDFKNADSLFYTAATRVEVLGPAADPTVAREGGTPGSGSSAE